MRLIQRFQRLGIATKQFVCLSLVTLTLFSAMVSYNLEKTKKLLSHNLTDYSQKIGERDSQLLSKYLEDVQDMMLYLSSDQERLLNNNKQIVSKSLNQYTSSHDTIVKSLYIVKENGTVYSNRQLFFEIIGNDHLQRLYQFAKKHEGGMSISEPYYSHLSGNTAAAVFLLKNNKNKPLAAIIAELDLNKLTKKLTSSYQYKNQTFLVMTAKGNVIDTQSQKPIIPYERGYPPKIDSKFIKKLSQLPTGVQYLKVKDQSLVAVINQTNRFGWYLVKLSDQGSFNKGIKNLYKIYQNVAFIWIVIMLLASLVISRSFTHPVRKLAAHMNAVEKIENISSLPINRKDEIGNLEKSYNAMLMRIKELVVGIKVMEERKRDYELKMLQSQIGPHFLYNTLACIGSLAKQKKMEEIRETVRSLVGLISYVLDNVSRKVTLKEELEKIRLYEQIQQVRYGKKFHLEINVDGEALDCLIPKFTLQPIIENAIFHGIIPGKRYGIISINGVISENDLKLYIRDNGLGMDKQQQAQLFNHKNESNSKKFNGIGLVNVHERIQMSFGQTYGLRVVSRQKVGTLVRIKMPAEFIYNSEEQ
ncbi:sensor histidine kinase YesM [Pullulanibacillus pueri]|uniref:histidine kinase n=1 Tax=Pullulanibacillus pueri TaxID=1437324 RepID=A0A8J2ZV25_9BACL|nr:sensor histidine kinase [Pullulanibacillus pueri]MBM7682224.1 sensor histidine kinase YesM [Pullulanibacillus pueri]GGH80514.1 histidine kinase [Pullulanibacillus pueri]